MQLKMPRAFCPRHLFFVKAFSLIICFVKGRILAGEDVRIMKESRRMIFFSYVRFFLYFCKMKVMIINGPNLNLLGVRQPEIYGGRSFEDYLQELRQRLPEVEIEYYQSNVEGELINKLHEVGFTYDGIVLNAGGYSHTSVAIHDAIASITTPVVEVHISNIFSREEYRRHSMLSDACKGVVCGLGLEGYRFAIESFLQ